MHSHCIDMQKDEYKTFTTVECRFDYRNSMFKEELGRYVILSVTFRLNKEGKLNFNYKDIHEAFIAKRVKEPTLKLMREIIIDIRIKPNCCKVIYISIYSNVLNTII